MVICSLHSTDWPCAELSLKVKFSVFQFLCQSLCVLWAFVLVFLSVEIQVLGTVPCSLALLSICYHFFSHILHCWIVVDWGKTIHLLPLQSFLKIFFKISLELAKTKSHSPEPCGWCVLPGNTG